MSLRATESLSYALLTQSTVFQQYHGWNAVQGGLAFLGLPIGGSAAVLVYALYFNKVYMRKHHELKPKMVPPEERLKPLMVAAPAFAISFFWGELVCLLYVLQSGLTHFHYQLAGLTILPSTPPRHSSLWL